MKKYNLYKYTILSILLGSIVGILTVLGQGNLQGNLNSFANSGAVWLVPAYYLAITCSKKWQSILSCFLCLLFSVLGYYVFESIYNNHAFSWSDFYFYLWCGCALVGGIIFGIGANISKQGQGMFKYCAMMLLPAVFLSEALTMIIQIEHYTHMVGTIYMWILIALILYFINAKKESFKLKPFLGFIIMSIGGVLGLSALTIIDYVNVGIIC